MKTDLVKYLSGKKIIILGFGKEGKSSFEFLSSFLPIENIAIADQNFIDSSLQVKKYCGENYLNWDEEYGLIIKSPGVRTEIVPQNSDKCILTSQTDLFLRFFKNQTIGVTGTKGKSTTVSLIYHILKNAGKDVLLMGNIGIPPFDVIDAIVTNTIVVFELSSHQLVDVKSSPTIAVLLNIYQEHLDHYKSFEAYQMAKMNIAKYQSATDRLIANGGDSRIAKKLTDLKTQLTLISHTNGSGICIEADETIIIKELAKTLQLDFSKRKNLKGNHNLFNIGVAAQIAIWMGVEANEIEDFVNSYKGLPHRMEYLGENNGIHFYNDSIATIPEATIAALKTIKHTETLILGGNDRGIDYSGLIEYLEKHPVKTIIFSGKAGQRILTEAKERLSNISKLIFLQSFNELPGHIAKNTQMGGVCLLSPAASSYDEFKNFEERGEVFKKMAGK